MATEVFELFAKLKLDSSEYNTGLSKAKSMAAGLGSTIGGALSTAAKVGSMALTAATGAVSVFAKKAISAGLAFDTAMGEVAATTGKDMEKLEKETGSVDTAFGHFNGTLRDFAKFMGKNTAFSASQASEALNYMALAGLNTQQSMEMLPKVLDMASAGAMNLGRASDMITDISSAVGLSLAGIEDPQLLQETSDRIGLMVDEFAKAAATGNTTVEMLGDAFLTVGGLAKEVNGGFITMSDGSQAAVDNLQQLEIAFTAMANAGVKGSEAGTHMRNILLKLANPTKGGQEAFDKMGISIYDMEGRMKPLNELFTELNASLSNMTQADKLSAIGEIFNARDTASAEALLAAVGQDWDRIGREILDAEGAASKMAETKLDNLNGDVTKFKSAMEGLQIAISDGLTPTLRKFVQFGTESISGLAEAFEKGDMSGVVDQIATILEKGLAQILDMAGPILTAGQRLIEGFVMGIVKNLPKVINAVKDFVPQIFSFIAEVGTELWPIISETVGMIASKIFDFILNTLPQMLPRMVAGLQNFMASLTNKLMELIGAIKELAPVIIQAGVDLIVTLAMGIADALPELLPAIVDAISFIAKELLSAENISRIINAGLELVRQLGWALVAAVPQLLEAAIELILSFCEYLVNPANLVQIVATAVELITQLALALVNAVPVLIMKIPDIIISIFSAFLGGIVSTDWLELGKQIIIGIGKGLVAAVGGLFRAIGDICSGIFNKIKSFFGIASPSKLMRDKVGKNIALGLVEGLEDGTSKVQDAMDDMIGAASGNINGNVVARDDLEVKHSGTIRIEGVNNQGEFVAASEYAIEEIITNIMKREARLA